MNLFGMFVGKYENLICAIEAFQEISRNLFSRGFVSSYIKN